MIPKARLRLFRLIVFLLPLATLALLEVGLRLGGFGASLPLFVPVKKAPEYLRVNRDVVRRFMVREADTPNLWIRPVYFPRKKGPDTFRIFVQGGSTAEGYPYGYGASPAGMLQQRLQRTFPEKKIEVITTAMSAVNTYTLLDFSDEILEQRPDAIVLYAGHNEYVGLLGVASGYSVGRYRPVVLTALALKNVRLVQLARRIRVALEGKQEAGGPMQKGRNLMATIVAEQRIPYGSSLYRRGLEQYRANLRALLSKYRKAGVPVFVGTVVSNERDQPPFLTSAEQGADVASWQRQLDAGQRALATGEALEAVEHFEAAVALDDLHAGGHFALGRALEAAGRYPEARDAYVAAKDRDELRFRAPEAINVILREVAEEQGARVVEVRDTFHRHARNDLVGHDLILEHLHPNLEGYFLMANTFYEALREAALIGPWDHPIAPETARAEMPVTAVDRLYGEYRILGLTSDWPFTETKTRFRPPRATDRVEEIAQSYFRGSVDWPQAMARLLDHYRRESNVPEAARVALLLANAFPHQREDQTVAAELLEAAGREGSTVLRRRMAALEAAIPTPPDTLTAVDDEQESSVAGEAPADGVAK